MATPAELLAQSLGKFQTANRIDGSRNSWRKDNPTNTTRSSRTSRAALVPQA